MRAIHEKQTFPDAFVAFGKAALINPLLQYLTINFWLKNKKTHFLLSYTLLKSLPEFLKF